MIKPRRILVTGSRHWQNREVIREALAYQWRQNPYDTLVSGACRTGADPIAESVWRDFGGTVERHEADWKCSDSDGYDPSAGPRRNQDMVDRGADICLAFPTRSSKGTLDCARRARAAGIGIIWHSEDGKVISTPGLKGDGAEVH